MLLFASLTGFGHPFVAKLNGAVFDFIPGESHEFEVAREA